MFFFKPSHCHESLSLTSTSTMIDALQAARLNHSLDSLNAGQQHQILLFIIVSTSPRVNTSSSVRISMAGLLCHRPPSTVFTILKLKQKQILKKLLTAVFAKRANSGYIPKKEKKTRKQQLDPFAFPIKREARSDQPLVLGPSGCRDRGPQERAVKVYNSKYSKIISSFVARARASSASFWGLGWRVAGAPLSRAEFRTS
jgi:hypothetical protein